VAETADPRRRDYFKPDFFNGIGHDRKTTTATTNGRSGLGNRSFEATRADGEVAPKTAFRGIMATLLSTHWAP